MSSVRRTLTRESIIQDLIAVQVERAVRIHLHVCNVLVAEAKHLAFDEPFEVPREVILEKYLVKAIPQSGRPHSDYYATSDAEGSYEKRSQTSVAHLLKTFRQLHAKILSNHIQDFCMFLEVSVNKLLHALNTYPDRALLKKSAATRQLKASHANADLAGALLSEGNESDDQLQRQQTKVVQFGESTVSFIEPVTATENSVEPVSPAVHQGQSSDEKPALPATKGILKRSGQKSKWKLRAEATASESAGSSKGHARTVKKIREASLETGRIPVALIEEGHPITAAFNGEMSSFEDWLRHKLADFSHFQEILLGRIQDHVRKREMMLAFSKTVHRLRRRHEKMDSTARREILKVIEKHAVDQQRYLNVFFSGIGAAVYPELDQTRSSFLLTSTSSEDEVGYMSDRENGRVYLKQTAKVMLRHKQNFEAIFFLHMNFAESIRNLVLAKVAKSLLRRDAPEAAPPPSKYLRMTRNQLSKFELAELGSPFLTFSYKESLVDYSRRLGSLATLLYLDAVVGGSNSSSFHYLLIRIREEVRHMLKRLRHGPKVPLTLSGPPLNKSIQPTKRRLSAEKEHQLSRTKAVIQSAPSAKAAPVLNDKSKPMGVAKESNRAALPDARVSMERGAQTPEQRFNPGSSMAPPTGIDDDAEEHAGRSEELDKRRQRTVPLAPNHPLTSRTREVRRSLQEESRGPGAASNVDHRLYMGEDGRSDRHHKSD